MTRPFEDMFDYREVSIDIPSVLASIPQCSVLSGEE